MSLWKQQNRKLDYSYYFNMDVIYLLVNTEIIIVLGLDYHLKINRIAYKKKKPQIPWCILCSIFFKKLSCHFFVRMCGNDVKSISHRIFKNV